MDKDCVEQEVGVPVYARNDDRAAGYLNNGYHALQSDRRRMAEPRLTTLLRGAGVRTPKNYETNPFANRFAKKIIEL